MRMGPRSVGFIIWQRLSTLVSLCFEIALICHLFSRSLILTLSLSLSLSLCLCLSLPLSLTLFLFVFSPQFYVSLSLYHYVSLSFSIFTSAHRTLLSISQSRLTTVSWSVRDKSSLTNQRHRRSTLMRMDLRLVGFITWQRLSILVCICFKIGFLIFIFLSVFLSSLIMIYVPLYFFMYLFRFLYPYLYAQTLVIDQPSVFYYSLLIRARQIIIDQLTSPTINIDENGPSFSGIYNLTEAIYTGLYIAAPLCDLSLIIMYSLLINPVVILISISRYFHMCIFLHLFLFSQSFLSFSLIFFITL